jgi:hypothetical protein
MKKMAGERVKGARFLDVGRSEGLRVQSSLRDFIGCYGESRRFAGPFSGVPGGQQSLRAPGNAQREPLMMLAAVVPTLAQRTRKNGAPSVGRCTKEKGACAA